MKTIYLIALFIIFSNTTFAQSERTLEETKAYIVKMLNEFAQEHNSKNKKLTAEFENDLLKIKITRKSSGTTITTTSLYNFTQVYEFKGPIREPGDNARIIVWVDLLKDKKNQIWKKENFDIDIKSYDVAEQLMNAFIHLNKLLLDKKPAVEKF